MGLASHATTNTVTKEAHDFKTNSNVYFALLIFSKTEQLRELAGVFPLPKASLLLVLGRTKLYCIYTWRRELVISVVPPFKLSATFISASSQAPSFGCP